MLIETQSMLLSLFASRSVWFTEDATLFIFSDTVDRQN